MCAYQPTFYKPLNMASLVNTEGWASAVGRFMLAFGSIEANINHMLQHWCSPHTYRFLIEMNLGPRIKFLRNAIDEHDLDDDARTILRQNLADVMTLAKTRNLIAHNPLVLALFEEGTEPVFREVIFSALDQKKQVTLSGLLDLVDQVEALDDAISQNGASIRLHGKFLPYGSEIPHRAVLERPKKA